MYPFGVAAAADDNADTGEDESASSSYMTNTSRVDIAAPRTPALDRRFPRFATEVAPQAMQAILEPGDLLVMPPGCAVGSLVCVSLRSADRAARSWWHSLKSLSVSFSVSMWCVALAPVRSRARRRAGAPGTECAEGSA
jgi:lysine-specific demethylase 8